MALPKSLSHRPINQSRISVETSGLVTRTLDVNLEAMLKLCVGFLLGKKCGEQHASGPPSSVHGKDGKVVHWQQRVVHPVS